MRPQLSQGDRDAIVEEIRGEFARHFDGPDPAMACLYWSFYACRVLARRGERAIIQAGPASWPCAAQDDGVSPTHLSYVWEPHSQATRDRIAAGLMPEMHVWVALPQRGELLDMTLGFQPAQARRLGVAWTAPAPPVHVWGDLGQLEAMGFLYAPNRLAIAWALDRLGLLPRHKPCRECPFSRSIAPGFTGGADPAVYVGQALGPFLLPCHKDPRFAEERHSPELVQCAGAAIYRANIGAADRLPGAMLRCPPDPAAVFTSPAELLAHHRQVALEDAEAELQRTPPGVLLERELARSGVVVVEAPRRGVG